MLLPLDSPASVKGCYVGLGDITDSWSYVTAVMKDIHECNRIIAKLNHV